MHMYMYISSNQGGSRDCHDENNDLGGPQVPCEKAS